MTVLVVGGGITGLTTAYALGTAGIPTLLLEASARLGGKVATESVDGFLIESGPDSFIRYRPAAVELCRELGLADELIAPLEPRVVYVRAGGRFARLPDGMGLVLPTRIRPFVTSDLFSPLQKLRMGADLFLPRQIVGGDVDVGAFLRRRLGAALVDRLAGPLIGGVYGTPIDELSLDAVVPQLREAERRHRSMLLASLADGRARRRSGKPAASPFTTLAGGTGRLVSGLIGAVRGLPTVEIRTGVPIRSVSTTAGGIEVRDGQGELIQAEAIVLATPAPVAADLLDEERPVAARSLRAIPYGSTAVVSLAYRDHQLPDDAAGRGGAGHGFLVAQGEPLTISACTLSSRKWAGRAPDGSVLVRAFIAGDRAGAHASDDELVAAATRDIRETLGMRGEPMLTRVARYPSAMPHYTVGHLERVAAANAALSDTPQIVLAGGAYRGVGLPDCIAQGRDAAGRVAALIGGTQEARPAEVAAFERATTRPAITERTGRAAEAPVALSALAIGRPGRIDRIAAAEGRELADDGIRVGSEVVITARAPFGGPLIVRVGRARIAVPRELAAHIDVRP